MSSLLLPRVRKVFLSNFRATVEVVGEFWGLKTGELDVEENLWWQFVEVAREDVLECLDNRTTLKLRLLP